MNVRFSKEEADIFHRSHFPKTNERRYEIFEVRQNYNLKYEEKAEREMELLYGKAEDEEILAYRKKLLRHWPDPPTET